MMSDTSRQELPDEIQQLFAELEPQEIELFYASYQQWALQQQIDTLQANIAALHQHIAENNERIQQVHPSAIALATLARLQANGVTDIDLLDSMLERGETWLDKAIQHLAYCERFEFMRDNYTDWCRNALEGAFDWIDSIHDGDTTNTQLSLEVEGTPSPATSTSEPLNQATEETLLQKLMSDGVEEEAMLYEYTEAPSSEDTLAAAGAADTADPPIVEYGEVTSLSEADLSSEDTEIIDPPIVEYGEGASPSEADLSSEGVHTAEVSDSVDTPDSSFTVEISDSVHAPDSPLIEDQAEIEDRTEEPLPILPDALQDREAPLPAELNAVASQAAAQLSMQQGNAKPLPGMQSRKLPRNRNFLQRLFFMLWLR